MEGAAPAMKILGISAHFHDSAAALVVDGAIVAAAQEERFTRKKHDAALPIEAARFCLERGGLDPAALDLLVYYEDPLEKFERILVSSLREFPRGMVRFGRAMSTWLSKRLFVKAELAERFGVAPDRILFSRHHLSHAASAFYCSPFDDAAIVTVDGVGEWATTSIFAGRGNDIDPIAELHFPHSIGLVYSAITAYLGFRVNEGEYKVMGLASYGEPRYLEELERICRIGDDASLEIDRRFFSFQHDAERSFSPALVEMLGPARSPGDELDPTAPEGRRFADVAASVQKLTERYMLRVARRAHELTGSRNLCLAGGVALNGVANDRISRESPFAEVFVQPAAGDAGGALGAALWASHAKLGVPRRGPLEHAFLGESHSGGAIARFLEDCRVDFVRHTGGGIDDEVADRLARGEIGGWFVGPFEWGPRALGARSILADPRRVDAKDRVNAKIKFRESFRPFAPAVLEDEIDRWFDLPPGEHLSPFMCTVAPATEAAKAAIPAVVHVDGTGRVQKVKDGSRLAELLRRFRARTGVGVLLNTSMNLKDEPIVGTPAEAYAMFVRSDLDFLVLEDCLVERRAA
jgi:carbamoyltransferase